MSPEYMIPEVEKGPFSNCHVKDQKSSLHKQLVVA